MYVREIELMKLDPLNERRFLQSFDAESPIHGICTCGHPSKLHKGWCTLLESCGCYQLNEVGFSSDYRPFFQVTHGPMEAHALGRGMRLASEMGIKIDFKLECQNWCTRYSQIGAVRLTKNRKAVLAKKITGESHVVLCNLCLNSLIFDEDA